MGNTPSCLDEPVKPTYNAGPPPWVNRMGFGRKKYEGRPDWWTECGMVDVITRDKKMIGFGARFLEEDQRYMDEKVPDGTSISGPFGLDSRYHPDLTKKFDQPVNLEEFRKKVMEGSAQYKNIAENFQLSKEHPGLNVSPVMDNVNHLSYKQLGKNFIYPNSWHHFGPRFWDKPINEDCFIKGLSAIKYIAIFGLPLTIIHLKAKPPADTHVEMLKIWGYKVAFKRYLSLLPIPMATSFAYTIALCTSANIRRKDDLANYWVASGVFGLTLASIKDNVTIGVTATIVTLLLGGLFHYIRVDKHGLQGRIHHQMTHSPHTGPFTWKFLSWGDMEVPKKNF